MQWRSYAPKHGIRPLNTMTVGDVDQILCKQKETVLLYMGRMVRKHVKSAFLPAFYSK